MLLKELLLQINERYEGSYEWDADMEKLQNHLKAAFDIINSTNWAKHVDDTEENFSVEGLREMHDKMYNAIEEAINAADDFYSTMLQAE
jgi:hypothetical protein